MMSNIDALLMRSVIKRTTDDYVHVEKSIISQNKVPKLNNGQIAGGAAQLRWALP